MSELRQREPRIQDPAWLAHIRALPCLVCRKPGPSDAAHLRSAALRYGKRHTGMGEKPDDRWTVPLCRKHHMEQHAHGSELAWWALQGIEPFVVAVRLYAGRIPSAKRPNSRKRAKIQQRVKAWPGRKIVGRNELRRAR